MRPALVRLVTSVSAILLTTAGLVVPVGAATAAPTWEPRPEDHPGTVLEADVPVEMSDGTVLRADVVRPVDADGAVVEEPLPVVVTITAYNKTILGSAGGLGGTDPDYLVRRGYVHATVDARGTGSSGGQWGAFSARENADATEIMTWAARQTWSDGSTAMNGPSYMGISQIFAAAGRPEGLKALFPQVPGADVYRDVVASGGQLDVGFIPLWLGLVTATGIIPPAVTATDPAAGLGVLSEHLLGAGAFTLPLLLDATTGGDRAYDGDFYAERSPINVIDDVDVPTFLVSGQDDLFQRGTPLLFDNLHERGVPAKLVVGPWDHLQASGGEGFEDAGYGTLPEMQLRWFDHHVKGLPDPTLDTEVAPVTQHLRGSGEWRRSSAWIDPEARATSLRLSGTARPGRPAALSATTARPGTSTVLPVPVAGLCTRSTNQWTAGLLAQLGPNPCFQDNRLNDTTAAVFETEVLQEPLTVQGPINARLYTSSLGGDGMLAVSVSDVAPDGTVSRLTGGWQVLSHRAVDESRVRTLDGKVIQTHHPFTREARKRLSPGQVAPVDVEVFPTAATIRPGHRLRLAVQSFDVPHLAPAVPDLLGSLSPLRVHASAQHPSELTIPTVPPVG